MMASEFEGARDRWILLALLLSACGGRGALHVKGSADGGFWDVGRDEPGPGDGSAASDVVLSSSPDTSPDGDIRDVKPDAGMHDNRGDVATDPVVVAMQGAVERYHLAWEELWRKRLAGCFNIPSASPSTDDAKRLADQFTDALRLRAVRVDESAMKACLSHLERLPCQQLPLSYNGGAPDVTRATGPSCPAVVVGLRRRFERCSEKSECAEGTLCEGSDECGGRCGTTPWEVGLGQNCDRSSCEEGLYCIDSICTMPPPDGSACGLMQGPCRAGSFCALSAAHETAGKCQTIAVGTPCDGPWQCAWPYTCTGSLPGRKGKCGPGGAEGTPCRLLGTSDGQNHHDCAPALQCVDLGRGLRCTQGSRPGEPCGHVEVAGGEPEQVGCMDGLCTTHAPGQQGRCVRTDARGILCEKDTDCAPMKACVAFEPGIRVCRDIVEQPLPLGSRCSLFSELCGREAYCGVDYPIGTPPPPDALERPGVCRAFAELGEACGEDFPCRSRLSCDGERCRACAP